MNITEEAVDAAEKYLAERFNWNGALLRETAREVVAAAAPHLMAQALMEASNALEAQPPKLRADYVSTLRLYAAEPWRLTTCPSECASINHPGAEHGAHQ